MGSRAAFLDRDGVINRKAPGDGYITRWEEMHFFPGVADAIGRLNRAGYLVVVVSNQRCVSKGLVTTDQLEQLHRQMCLHLEEHGARIDAVYYCPHEEQPLCACRKPQPGMLLDAARAHDIDLDVSWMIGDSDKDVQAGKKAGCKTARLLHDHNSTINGADVSALSLLDAVSQILKWEQSAPSRRNHKRGTRQVARTGVRGH